MPETPTSSKSRQTDRASSSLHDAMAAAALEILRKTGQWPSAWIQTRVLAGGALVSWALFARTLRNEGTSLTEFLRARFPDEPEPQPRPKTEPRPYSPEDDREELSAAQMKELDERIAARPLPNRELSRSQAREDAEIARLKTILAAKPRPEGPGGIPNIDMTAHEVDNPSVHGWLCVPDSRTPEEREMARQPGFVPLYPGHVERPLRDVCDELVAEFRKVKRRHRRIARKGGWEAGGAFKIVGRMVYRADAVVEGRKRGVACAV